MKNPFAKEKKVRKPRAKKVLEVIEVPEDRSAYNCEPCKGEGLKSEREICPNCEGTGKV